MAKNKNTNECSGPLQRQGLESYIKEVDHVTADIRRFAHKLRKIKSGLLGPRPSLGRS